ncbi:MAG: hypothetical protein KatS3mg057_2815 [Herpetosiphonaceae bacterium]|nr:MAG: hypothetical protein KatS3mg057_2815 [Herpetosiphonaceae bacterium]
MADMLVKLYTLPDITPLLSKLNHMGVEVRRAAPMEKAFVTTWVHRHFSTTWAAECETAFTQRPVTCYIAVRKERRETAVSHPYALPPERILGFACYDVTRKGMFGPEGVRDKERGYGLGTALLVSCLQAMEADGYAYAVIGWAGPTEFYRRAVAATIIEGSEPGIYRGPLLID